ncbi:hypothetical protein BHE74_00043591 [Ensete ventricosum]|nr:hypothetical protein BHE74_00043591 [Ensete ventricosum]RZS28012.1 hypothetical protein BHM03_00061553 [Ensete ventricosum]
MAINDLLEPAAIWSRPVAISLAAQVASSDLSLQCLLPTIAISASPALRDNLQLLPFLQPPLLPATSRPHQSPIAHTVIVLFYRSCMTLLSLFFPCYSSAGHTAAAVPSSATVVPSSTSSYSSSFYRSRAFATTASTAAACSP